MIHIEIYKQAYFKECIYSYDMRESITYLKEKQKNTQIHLEQCVAGTNCKMDKIGLTQVEEFIGEQNLLPQNVSLWPED